MDKASQKLIFQTLAATTGLALFFGQRHAGFMLGLFLIPLLCWVLHSVYVMVTKPEQRKLLMVLVTIWITAFLAASGFHYNLHHTTRKSVDDIANAVLAYMAKNGTCPVTLDEVGVNRQELKEKLGTFGHYACDAGKSTLFYAVTYIPFDTYHYNFETKEWGYED